MGSSSLKTLTDAQRNRAFKIIIANQCLGMVSGALFSNGFFLNYFDKLGLGSARIAMLFALPPLVSAVLLLPFAYVSDRFGKKKLALTGQGLLIASLFMLLAVGWGSPAWVLPSVLIALAIYSIGGSLQGASWFALLNPIVPPKIRGRFFGRLRVIFQMVGIAYTVLITRTLEVSQSMGVFQGLLALVFVAAVFRLYTYAQIPELENASGEQGHRDSLIQALHHVMKVPGYVSFNAYVLLITLFTASIPMLFGLMEKDVFGFTASQITLMGMLLLVGNVCGCGLGGRLVDRFGTRAVLLVCHLGYALVLGILLTRFWSPLVLPVHMGICTLLFSLISGTAGVALTSETMALIPAANKSLSTGFTMTLFSVGTGLSGMFVSRFIQGQDAVSGGMLFGQTYTTYDTLVFFFASMILMMLLAIGLVPVVVKKAQPMPNGSSYPRM